MEQVIVITVFAICAAICVNILSYSFSLTSNAVDTRSALLVAENAAESHKAFRGDIVRMAQSLGGDDTLASNEGALTVFFDSDWLISGESGASFALSVMQRGEGAVILADITVSRLADSNDMITLTAAARRL